MFTPEALLALTITLCAGLATLIGSSLLLFAQAWNTRLLSWGLGFAGGAMVYVSFTEIFTKSYSSFITEYAHGHALMFTTLCFFAGIAVVVLLDHFIPNPHATFDDNSMTLKGKDTDTDYNHTQLRRISLLTAAAITAHNFPEGAATFFATLENPGVGLPLAFAIAIHNIPEGVSIALPVYYATGSKKLAFGATLISALAEPIGATIAYLVLAPYLSEMVYGIIFAMIAGAMVFLSLDELLPVARAYAKNTHDTVYSLILGMAVIAASLVLFAL